MTEPYLNISHLMNETNTNQTYDNITAIFNDDLVRVVSISVFISFSFIFLAGLVGNGLVVMVVAANPMMRSTTNILIINLAVSDLLFVIFCVPFTATDYVLNYWPFGDYWCRFVQYMIVVTCHASVYTLVLMSLDRFLAVVHPITSISIRTEANAMLSIGVAWLLITITAIPVMFSHGEAEFVDEFYSIVVIKCVFLSQDGYNHPVFQISFFLSSYVVPLTLISVLYVCMLASLWKGQAPGGKVSAESRRGKRRVTRMIIAVVLAFAICWLPIQIILVIKSIDPYYQSTLFIGIQILSHVLAYSSSCVNPLLYAFLSENFRKAFRKVVKCGTPHTLETQITTKIARNGNEQSIDIL